MMHFWQTKTFEQMTPEEWESLCDGCGKCCLIKLEDADDGQIYYTDVACRYLNTDNARCRDYANRLENVASCLNLTPATVRSFNWLPATCAYRLLANGQSLPDWHPLRSGALDSTLQTGQSVAHRVVSEEHVHEDEWAERLIHWVDV